MDKAPSLIDLYAHFSALDEKKTDSELSAQGLAALQQRGFAFNQIMKWKCQAVVSVADPR